MRRDHRNRTVGPWAEQKLVALEDYLRFYNTVLKKRTFTRVYIDAFAGSPVSKVRVSDVPEEPSPYLDDTEASEAREQFILGSPVRALGIEEGFHRHYFLISMKVGQIHCVKYVREEMMFSCKWETAIR